MYSRKVTTKDGTEKTVMADTMAELEQAVKIHEKDELTASPNIDNPDHGNVRVQDFRDGKLTPKAQRAEAFPTSDASKQVSRELAGATDNDNKEEKDMADEARLKDEQENKSAEERTEGEVAQTEQVRKDADKQENPKDSKNTVDSRKKV